LFADQDGTIDDGIQMSNFGEMFGLLVNIKIERSSVDALASEFHVHIQDRFLFCKQLGTEGKKLLEKILSFSSFFRPSE
jgi:hypothetical protein